MARTALLGLPRMGADRELKLALDAHWSGRLAASDLLETARALRVAGWQRAQTAGIDVVPSGDFSLYDHVLDTAWGLGAIPERFGDPAGDDLAAYFAMARGTDGVRPLEMTKWFDTNYHYLVPELREGGPFRLRPEHWVGQFRAARAAGIGTRPVVLGPLSFLLLSKGLERPLAELPRLVAVYRELLGALADAGAGEVQIDEPFLPLDRTPAELDEFAAAWSALARDARTELCLAMPFAGLDGDTMARVLTLDAAEFHLDLVRAPEQFGPALAMLAGRTARLSLGIVDGRNVWVTDPDAALERIDAAIAALGSERVTLAPSCSLLHLPHSAARETGIDPEVRAWLAFAAERQDELALLARATAEDRAGRAGLLAAARDSVRSRAVSRQTTDPAVRERLGGVSGADLERRSPLAARREIQRARLGLPELPTTTIGSFPQTEQIRETRRNLRAGRIDAGIYDRLIEDEIAGAIATQERIGLDVLVHGEAERNDMVEYFGQQLDGFAFSEHGWVQSYGSRCVKPPILFGDVSRPRPMTERWWRYAQELTGRPVKGMLTGPVTILQWSFVRDDQPQRETCTQIALAIRDEVLDLERAGAALIQVDEAALREGLPLQRRLQDDYLRWAVDCFRLTVGAVADETQIHTHMCYSDFAGIIDHIARLDADVISIEAARSDMSLLDAFTGRGFPGEIGPGVYDIHSPRVPPVEEIERLLALAEERFGRDRLWVNPDCGLKTRRWDEVIPALEHMTAAAGRRRAATGVLGPSA
jgi:5-methyltetrahydropteroyltriglutamate--homocysteine methyltransferase